MYTHRKHIQRWRSALLAFYHLSGPLALLLLFFCRMKYNHIFVPEQLESAPPELNFCLTCLSKKLVLSCGSLSFHNHSTLLCADLFWSDGSSHRYAQLQLRLQHLYNSSISQRWPLQLQPQPQSATTFYYEGCVNRSIPTAEHIRPGSFYVDLQIPRPGNTYLKGFL